MHGWRITDSAFSMRLFRRSALLLTLCLLLALLSGCGGAGAGGASGVTNDSGAVIGFVGTGSSEDAQQTKSERATLAGLRQAGFTVRYFATDSVDPQAQINAVTGDVAEGVDAIVLASQFTNMWNDTLVAARNAGIPVVLLGRKPTFLKAYLYDSFIGPSGFEVGENLVRWVEKNAEESHSYRTLYVQTPLVSSFSSDVLHGWKAASKKTTEKITAAVGAWTAQGSADAVSQALDAFDDDLPEVVVAGNAAIAEQVRNEVTARGASIAQRPQKGAVCIVVIGAGGENAAGAADATDATGTADTANAISDDISASVTWDTDYSAPLVRTLTKVLRGESVVKDQTVSLNTSATNAE